MERMANKYMRMWIPLVVVVNSKIHNHAAIHEGCLAVIADQFLWVFEVVEFGLKNDLLFSIRARIQN